MDAFLAPASIGGGAYLAPSLVPEADIPASAVTGVTVSPATASGSVTLVATVQGENGPSQAVTWSRAPALGNVSNGVFAAPEPDYVERVITVTATSVQDPAYSDFATITIAALPPRVPAPAFSVTKRGRGRFRSRR